MEKRSRQIKAEKISESNEPNFITTFPSITKVEGGRDWEDVIQNMQDEEEEPNYAGEKMTKAEQEKARKQIWAREKEARAKREAERRGKDSKLENRLNYLYEIPEISWVRFDDNSVYIGFTSIPSDITLILGGAAFFGNKAIDFGVHVYAYDACRYGPTTGGNFFRGATCRHGKVKHY